MKILMSAVGATDPVRGGYDGAMLHIARHCRPDMVCLFISKEMLDLDAVDHRYQRAFDMLADQTDGYRPEIRRIEMNALIDPSQISACDRRFREEIKNLRTEKGADTEFLLNLSSGTPQMKDSWKQICLEKTPHIRGLQVVAPSRRSNQDRTTTSDGYDLDAELENNYDSLPGAEDRTREPDLTYDRRGVTISQIRKLNEQFDYAASCLLMKDVILTDDDKITLKILEYARDRLDLQQSAGTHLKYLPDDLRAVLFRTQLDRLYDYALLLDCLARSGRVSEFIIRLNPMVIELEMKYLEKVFGVKPSDYCENKDKTGGKHYNISSSKLEQFDPDLLTRLESHMRRTLTDGDPSQFVLKNLLSALFDKRAATPEQQKAYEFFEACQTINKNQRNDIAHALTAATEDSIIAQSGGHNIAYFNRGIQTVLRQIDKRATSASFGEDNPYAIINRTVSDRLFL